MTQAEAASDETEAAPQQRPAAPRVPVPGDRIGRFFVVDVLGQGAMGVVVRAFDPRLERTLAIKVVNPRRTDKADRLRARLVAEARALARISHPNVVAVYEVDVHEGLDYVAMELVDGIDLQRWLRQKPRGWREIVRAFAAVADGLHAVHLAGLLHRDIKPANILVGNDGRVRVGDFGIATRRAAELTPSLEPVEPSAPGDAAPAVPAGLESDEVTSLTEDGQVVGTPAYMAPEQHLGAALTPAADQYAFCVSLFEALWGRRPFMVPLLQLAAAKRTPPREPPRGGVPRWLFKVVARGLDPEPSRRHVSMGALATALRRDLGRRRRRVAFAAATCAGIAAGAVVMAGTPPCAGAEAKLAGVWDAPMRAAVEQAFAASTRPYAGTTWAQVSAQLDDYAARWTAMHTDACEATRVRGEQSEALLDRRMICLEQRRDGLAAAVELLRTGDDDTVDHAFTMVGRLRAIAPCGDAEAMAAQVAPPDDVGMRAHVDTTRAAVARARASYDAGRYDEALTLADAATATARSIGYEPLVAEALAVQGEVLQTRERHDESRAALREATWSALALGHDAVAVEAASSLIWLEAEYLRDFDAAAQWVDLTRAALRRQGSPPSLAARAGNAIGVSLANRGRYDEALAEYEHALALVEDDPAEQYTAHSLRTNIANVYMSQGEGARAREIYEREVVAFEALLGTDHPKVNLLRRLLADAIGDAGERARAIELNEAVVASMQRVYGEHASELGSAWMSLALAYGRDGRDDEALALYYRARDIFSASGDRSGLAIALANIGDAELRRGAFDAAERSLGRALAIQREIYGGDHGDMVYPSLGMANIRLEQQRYDEAAQLAAEAERIARATLGPHAHELIVALSTRESVLTQQGRLTEAVVVAREVLALALRSDDVRAATRPIARGHLAGLLARTGAPAEALTLLDEALRELEPTVEHAYRVELQLERAAVLQQLQRPGEARAAAAQAVAEAERRGLGELAARGRTLAPL